jgi:hypothetical protein
MFLEFFGSQYGGAAGIEFNSCAVDFIDEIVGAF